MSENHDFYLKLALIIAVTVVVCVVIVGAYFIQYCELKKRE